MKSKEGRRTSHSYWSWTHGPRWTTHDSSGKRPWWWRSSRWWFSPPAGCREEFSWCSRSWKRRRRRNRDGIAKRSPVLRVTGNPLNICQSRAPGGSRGAEAPPRRGPGGARPQGAWSPVPPQVALRTQCCFRITDFLYIFSGFFWAVLETWKPEIQKQPKTETGTGVHWISKLVQIWSKVYGSVWIS